MAEISNDVLPASPATRTLTDVPVPGAHPDPRGTWAAVRDTIGAVVGAVLGLAPHVLHHVGLIAGAALVTGAAGNGLFFAVGLLFSVPLLRRLHRRFASRWAPTIAVAVFTGMFAFSALVIGPALTSGSSSGNQPSSPTQTPVPGHDAHHSG